MLLPSKMHGMCCSVQASCQRSRAGSIICCQKCVANGVACEWCTSLNICTRLKSCKLQLTLVWSLKGQHFKSLFRFSVLEKYKYLHVKTASFGHCEIQRDRRSLFWWQIFHLMRSPDVMLYSTSNTSKNTTE